MRRTWLLGRHSAQYALLLHTAVNKQPFTEHFVPGTSFQAALHFWPGSYPLRAMTGAQLEFTGAPATFWHAETMGGFLDRQADALAVNPWLQRMPLVLSAAIPVQQNGQWWVLDQEGHGLPVRSHSMNRLWSWLAHCGGRPADIAGEWQAGAFHPLAMYFNQCYQVLSD